jgi:hypothetical protein
MRYGSLTFPASARNQIDAAFAYLRRDPVERALIASLEHSRVPHRITINHHGDDAYLPWSHTIRWDPTSAMFTSRGGRQSPALGLGHELDHAAENPVSFERFQNVPDPHYDNAEEWRVITGSERHAAQTLHESTRDDHDGRLYRVAGPTLR